MGQTTITTPMGATWHHRQRVPSSVASALGYKQSTLFAFILLIKKLRSRSSHCGSAETNPTSIHDEAGSIPGFAQWVKDPGLP